MRNVLCDVNVNLRTRRKLLEACVRSRLPYGTQAWYPREHELARLEACWHEMLRSMVRGGWSRKQPENPDEEGYAFKCTNEKIQHILKTTPLRDYINMQYLRYVGYVQQRHPKENAFRHISTKVLPRSVEQNLRASGNVS